VVQEMGEEEEEEEVLKAAALVRVPVRVLLAGSRQSLRWVGVAVQPESVGVVGQALPVDVVDSTAHRHHDYRKTH
jgi:hypothetical protein